MKHFIIFQKADAHSCVWLSCTPSLYEAIVEYALKTFAHSYRDTLLLVDNGNGQQRVYSHPLEAIEMEEKPDGEWQIREVRSINWSAKLAEVYCGESPFSVKEYIDICTPMLRQQAASHKVRAFVWYLTEGPLVTFYRKRHTRQGFPIKIIGRYIIPWTDWPQVHEWNGTYSDLLEQLLVDYPSSN